MRTEITPATALAVALLRFQAALISEGMELPESFLVSLVTILAIGVDVLFAIKDIYSTAAIHITSF